jgi:hypothetical protein
METRTHFCPPSRQLSVRDMCLIRRHKQGNYTCEKPHPWRIFLQAHQNRGWTKARIRSEYNKLKRSGKLTSRHVCQMVRDSLKNEDRDLFILGDPCYHFTSNPEWRPDTTWIRDKIIHQLLHKGKKLDRFDTVHIHEKDITPHTLMRIVRLVDYYYFRGTLLRRLKSRRILLTIGVTSGSGDRLTYAWTEWSPDRGTVGGKPANSISMMIAADNFVRAKAGIKHRHFYGMTARHPLESLVMTVEHELGHVFVMAFCPQRAKFPHDSVFLKLVENMFGHSNRPYVGNRTEPKKESFRKFQKHFKPDVDLLSDDED